MPWERVSRASRAHAVLQVAVFALLGGLVGVAVLDPAAVAAPVPRGYTGREEALKHAMVAVAERRKGVFINKAARPRLGNTLVVTMANWGFRDFFMNWACAADGMGMDYMVLAADRQMHTFLGGARAVLLADGVGAKLEWGSEGYYDLGCQKLEAVAYLVELGYNVLFSDADNVIGRIPAPLLAEIAAGEYDALIQADHPDCQSRAACPLKWDSAKTANGGFYYISAKRRGAMTEMLRRAHDHCTAAPRTQACCDDQQALNKALHATMTASADVGAGGFPAAEFCAFEAAAGGAPENPGALQFCVMHPDQHPAGRHEIVPERYAAAGNLQGPARNSQPVRRLAFS
eukprot:TRINITY_DN5564_c0_g3_i1.p1 TRINITY_DN5564_c0_g3~~TRINITY_DN5564_c0_g3_i1.p1  ORF type:complete len:345 (+),score=78.75 TRINITY_DN5564_c0_g3_i1:125-1159(+)